MKESQGRRLIKLLKHRPMTALELQLTGISTCWHKRVKECLQDGEVLKPVGKRGRSNIYRVVVSPKTVWRNK
jgi:hypothetical protein